MSNRSEVKTRTKRKYLIHRLEINGQERFRQFEIRLPANVKQVTGILITTSLQGS